MRSYGELINSLIPIASLPSRVLEIPNMWINTTIWKRMQLIMLVKHEVFHKGLVEREITNASLGFKKEDTCFH